jgi:predicted peroxiredoxin
MTLHVPGSQPKPGGMPARKLMFMVTHGPEHPETATIPFATAVAAQASGVDVVMGFQIEGVRLLQRGIAEGVAAPGFVPLKELMDIYHSNGGVFFACGPCVASRGIQTESFIDGAQVMNAPVFIEQFLTAQNVLVY